MVKSIVSGLGEMRKDWQKSGCNTRYNSYKLLGGLLQNPEIDNPVRLRCPAGLPHEASLAGGEQQTRIIG